MVALTWISMTICSIQQNSGVFRISVGARARRRRRRCREGWGVEEAAGPPPHKKSFLSPKGSMTSWGFLHF